MAEDIPELTRVEKRLIYELGGDLGESPQPFRELGQRVGLAEDEVIAVVIRLSEKGLMRRFGATLRHQRSGFTANAMIAWEVPADRVGAIGRQMASYPQVTHCYQRRTVPGWTKNLYTMVHGATEDDCYALAARMAEETHISNYELLFSQEELKKTSMRYFG
jgi:siroheme decarboxylase